MKYLGVLIDGNLSWKHHINYISTKISKGTGVIARLGHLVPRTTLLLNIYRSLSRTVYFLLSLCLGPNLECSFKQNRHFTKAGSSFNVFFPIIHLTVLLFLLVWEFYQSKCFTSNWLPLCYMKSKIIVLLPIFLNFLLALNRLG